jgi:hypothetical protein
MNRTSGENGIHTPEGWRQELKCDVCNESVAINDSPIQNSAISTVAELNRYAILS